MAAGKEWVSSKGTDGAPTRDVRFESAGRALALARERNRDIEQGGSSCPVLIEGIKDVKALRKFGFTGVIEQLNRGWDRSRLVAYLFEKYGCNNPNDGGPALILLMDWDRTGGRIQNDMSMRLRGMDMALDEETRMVLLRAMKPEGKTVESLAPFARDLREKMSFHDPDGSDGEE